MARRSLGEGGGAATSSFSYPEALAWLYSLQVFGIKLGLENIQRLISELTRRGGAKWGRVIHVAGTNGKGSVCAMIDAILRAEGYKTGLFTSPHLVTFRERIRVNGEMISEEDVAQGLNEIRELISNWEPYPTFFEVATALALKYFTNSSVDVTILETGLGGRLDATNAVPADVSAITPIDLDHQKWLGDSLEKIAGEKAGIIKPKTPVVSARQQPEAGKVIRARAKECEAPLQIVDATYGKSEIALAGSHQKENAAVAVAALRAAKIDLSDSAIASGLSEVEWPARFQRWDDQIVIDGAHNPAAARILAQTWRENFGEKQATLILAVLSDKDGRGIYEALALISESVVLPRIRSERALSPERLAETLFTIAPSLPYSITSSIGKALDQARVRPNPILITGSLHFAGEALAYLQGKPAAFEECTQ